MTGTERPAVTVIGLGNMGAAVARAFLERGYRTTVWNRTADRADPLLEAGAEVASTAAKAVAASPLSVLSLLDNTAVDDVLDAVGSAAAGHTLVSLTSGSPAQARRNESWAIGHGAAYVDGKVMGDPPDVGTPRISLAFSGDRVAFDAVEGALRDLGSLTYHGPDAGFAAVEFNEPRSCSARSAASNAARSPLNARESLGVPTSGGSPITFPSTYATPCSIAHDSLLRACAGEPLVRLTRV